MHRKLAERLQEYYRESELTYDEIAQRSGISRSTVHRLITKPPETPRPDTMEQLVIALGHTKEELYEGLDALPTEESDYQIVVLREAVASLQSELAAERKLQQSLADQLAKSETLRQNALNIFKTESLKNDTMLQNHQKINEELRATRDYERKQKNWSFIALAISVGINIASLGSMVLYTIRAMK